MERISKRLLRKLPAAVLATTALTLTVLAAVPAHAGNNAKINSIGFTTQNFESNIIVRSSDGKKWDKIEAGPVVFSAHMSVDTAYPGYVSEVGVFLGHCENHQCGNGYPLVFWQQPHTRDYEQQTQISFSASRIPVSGAGIAVVPYGNEILAECNAHLQPDGATKQHTFTKGMTASFSVHTLKGNPPPLEVGAEAADWAGGEITRHSAFATNVTCKPYRENPDGVVGRDPGALKVGSIELFRSTYSNANTHPNATTVCKKGRLLVRLETNKPGAVKFKLWTKIGDAPMTQETIDAWASRADTGIDTAEYERWVEVNKTSLVLAMAEDLTNPIGQSTGWKDITLTCTDDRLATNPTPKSKPTKEPKTRLTGQATQTPPTISCIGGISTGTTCICREPTEKVQTGPNAYRCVMGDMTSVRPIGPFGLRKPNPPGIMVGPPGHPYARPLVRPFDRQSSLPPVRPMMFR